MANNLSPVFLLLVLGAACGLIPAEPEAEKINQQVPSAPVSETLPVDLNSPAHAESGKEKGEIAAAPRPGIESLSRDEIRRVQAALKASGFDPGPIDGILGPGTKSALRRLQSGCVALQGGLKLSTVADARLKPVPEPVQLAAPVNEASSKAEIQKLQERLRQSGFNPGPVDGILGLKTKAALIRARSGCALAKQFGATEATNVSVAANQPARNFVPPQPTDKRASNLLRFSNSFDREDKKLIALVEQTPGPREIRFIQKRLKNAGFDPGPIDGILGPQTRLAFESYRASRGFRDVTIGSAGNGSRIEY